MTCESDHIEKPYAEFEAWERDWQNYFANHGDILTNLSTEEMAHIYGRESDLYMSDNMVSFDDWERAWHSHVYHRGQEAELGMTPRQLQLLYERECEVYGPWLGDHIEPDENEIEVVGWMAQAHDTSRKFAELKDDPELALVTGFGHQPRQPLVRQSDHLRVVEEMAASLKRANKAIANLDEQGQDRRRLMDRMSTTNIDLHKRFDVANSEHHRVIEELKKELSQWQRSSMEHADRGWRKCNDCGLPVDGASDQPCNCGGHAAGPRLNMMEWSGEQDEAALASMPDRLTRYR